MNEKKLPLNSLHLKLLAAASMLIDHMRFTLFPFAHWMRCVGRLAFPIFCFLIAEGCAHTRDKKRYAVRLLLFALLSELPFNLMCTGQWFSLQYQNVLWTLLLGALVCWAMDWAKTKPEMWQRLPADAAIAAGFILGQWGNTDYGGWGVLLVLLFYLTREVRGKWASSWWACSFSAGSVRRGARSCWPCRRCCPSSCTTGSGASPTGRYSTDFTPSTPSTS